MATDKEFLTFVLDQLNDPQITTRPMMGEYVLYYAGKPVGGLYDDRLLVKITPSTEPLAQTGEPLSRAARSTQNSSMSRKSRANMNYLALKSVSM